MRIGNRGIGKTLPCFIIAEAGINHNGRIDLAKKLIDVAADSGADAVKFQMFKTEKLFSKNTARDKHYKTENDKDVSLFSEIKSIELTNEMCEELFNYSREKEIIFFASAFDAESVDFLNDLGVEAFKIASCDITNFPLLKKLAKTGKPLILSTGMSTLEEVKEAFSFLKENGTDEIALLHCLAEYPTTVEESNLKAIKTLEREFDVPVGFSDHSNGTLVPAIAVAAGAKIIEKHFTLDKNMRGFDHKASANPEELTQIVREIRLTEKALGNGEKTPTKSEERLKKTMRRSIVATMDIKKGVTIKEEMLAIKRPGTGLSSKSLPEVIGKKAKRDIKEDELILLEDLQ
jgi:N-acetylneuraminate synthase/N,N'-diacetyllegionaminate synthase